MRRTIFQTLQNPAAQASPAAATTFDEMDEIYGIDEIHIEAVDPTVLATLFENLKVTTTGMETFTIVNGQTSLPAVAANAGEDKEICAGGAVTLGGNPTGSGGMLPRTYVWSPATGLDDPNSPTPVASPTVTTTYTVTVTADEGGSATDEVTVTVNPAPVANAGMDQNTAYGQTITLGGAESHVT